MAGARLSKDQVNDVIGQALLDVNVALTNAAQIKSDFFHLSDNDLGTNGLGFTADEITLLRAAFDDMEQLYRIYRGQDPLPASKNFRQNIRKLWGLGVR